MLDIFSSLRQFRSSSFSFFFLQFSCSSTCDSLCSAGSQTVFTSAIPATVVYGSPGVVNLIKAILRCAIRMVFGM